LFCWIGFNPGSALLLSNNTVERGSIAGHAAVTTVLSAAAAMVNALSFHALQTYRKNGEFDLNVVVAMNGW
jgi:ammonia channel protein AmtB